MADTGKHCDGCRGAVMIGLGADSCPGLPEPEGRVVAAFDFDYAAALCPKCRTHTEEPDVMCPRGCGEASRLVVWLADARSAEKAAYSAPPRLDYITGAGDDFAAGRISAGKLAELLGVSDVHAFKRAAHSDCDAPIAAPPRTVPEAIVREIVEAMDAEAEIVSSPGATSEDCVRAARNRIAAVDVARAYLLVHP